MLGTLFFYGVVVALVLLVVFGLVLFMRYQGTSANLMKSAYIMESRVYRAVAEIYGVAPALLPSV